MVIVHENGIDQHIEEKGSAKPQQFLDAMVPTSKRVIIYIHNNNNNNNNNNNFISLFRYNIWPKVSPLRLATGHHRGTTTSRFPPLRRTRYSEPAAQPCWSPPTRRHKENTPPAPTPMPLPKQQCNNNALSSARLILYNSDSLLSKNLGDPNYVPYLLPQSSHPPNLHLWLSSTPLRTHQQRDFGRSAPCCPQAALLLPRIPVNWRQSGRFPPSTPAR